MSNTVASKIHKLVAKFKTASSRLSSYSRSNNPKQGLVYGKIPEALDMKILTGASFFPRGHKLFNTKLTCLSTYLLGSYSKPLHQTQHTAF